MIGDTPLWARLTHSAHMRYGGGMDENTTIEYLRALVKGVDDGEWTTEQVVDRLRDTLDADRIGGARPWHELVSTGLLWYLNRTALWPRGYALGVIHDGEGLALGWDLTYDGEPITSSRETENDRFQAVERLFWQTLPA